MKRYTKENFISMPWKNGGGITSELYRFNETHKLDFDLRISVATVSNNGNFSYFPGIDRHLLILEGEGCEINFESKQVQLTVTSAPLFFQGEDKIHCKLINGPVKDFNVMVNRDWGSARVFQNVSGEQICRTEMSLFYNTQADEILVLTNGEEVRLNASYIQVDVTLVNSKHKAD